VFHSLHAAARPVKPPKDSEQTFEIALIFAGAVSVGIYTAGLSNYLIE